jgi:16S rRNA U516 pseudouridylate synthase RsuA-like enzyme
MVEKVGHRVVRLHRIRVADLKLGGLTKGEWRHLTRGEARQLLSTLQLSNHR